jgi:predicted NBD/HSP70 family sugar kinase
VLALDFGGTKTAVAVCDLTGSPLASATVSPPADGCPPAATAVFRQGIEAARELLSRTAPGSPLAAVGAATFGIPFEDRVELAPTIDGWESLAFGRELRAAFSGVPVRLATDAKAAAAAESRWGALRGCDPGVFLNLGTGLAAAIVIGGRVLSGRDGAAGEIGYNLRGIADVGRPLPQRIPLEDVASGQGIARQAARRRGHGPGGAPSAAGVFQASQRDPELASLLSDTIAELSYHLVNLAICLNPARIAVGGGLVRSWDRLGPPLAQALGAGTPFPPDLVVARFPYDAPLRGAAALAAETAADSLIAPDTLTKG